jgi:spore coat polysaccharide biosynthesis predicted glycosyltransferase SpsG
VDGGNIYSVAMGHVYRCLKLAEFLKKKRNVSPVFIMKDYREGVKKVKDHSFEVFLLDKNCSSADDCNETAKISQGGYLVVDVRHYTAAQIALLKESCNFIVVFDDLGAKVGAPDVLINPAVSQMHRRYPGRIGGTKYLLGPRFFLLDGKISRTTASREVKNILVSLGGADPAGYTKELAEKIGRISEEYNVTFVLGPAFKNPAGFRKTLRNLNFKARVLFNVKNLGALMAKADLAMVSGGDTCLELAFTGTSGIIIPTISYELGTAKYLQQKKVFLNLGDIKEKSASEVEGAVIKFIKNYKKRRLFSENGKKVVDANGFNRVTEAIFPASGRN